MALAHALEVAHRVVPDEYVAIGAGARHQFQGERRRCARHVLAVALHGAEHDALVVVHVVVDAHAAVPGRRQEALVGVDILQHGDLCFVCIYVCGNVCMKVGR